MPQASSASAPIETNIGKYRLIASLGHGGMADVYLAVTSGPGGFNKLQVIKRLRKGDGDEQEHVEMFLDEARLAAKLTHPNVVQTYEVAAEGGEHFMVMEYLDGVPLNRLLGHVRKYGRGKQEMLLHIVADALSGLHYAHELQDFDGTPLNVVHRDASPHNIIVTFDGQTKLLDFGIAKSASRSSMTRAGILKGKIAYMAPEQALSQPLDKRADIFVLGITFWEIITGHRFWEGCDEMAVLRRLGLGLIPSAAEIKPDVAPELLRICGRALAPAPEDRYSTAAEMRSDILAYLKSIGADVTAEDVGAYLTSELSEKRNAIRKIIELQLNKLRNSIPPSIPDFGVIAESSSLPLLGSSSDSTDRSQSDSVRTGYTPPSSTHPSRRVSPPESAQTLRPPQVIEVTPSRGPLATTMSSAAVAESPSKPNRTPLLVIGGLSIGALAMWFALGHGGSGATPTQNVDLANSHVAATPATTTAPSAAATTSPTATMIELRVHAQPEKAEIYIDDARLPTNPFVGKFPADGAAHKLRVEAPDHKTTNQVVVFDKDSSIDVALEAKPTNGKWAAPAPTAIAAAPASANTTADDTGLGAGPKSKVKRQLGDDPFAAPAPTSTSTKPKRQLGEGM